MRLERLVSGCLLAMALFWVGASVFVRGAGVPDWWLPASLVGGIAAALGLQASPGARAPRWALWVALSIVAVAFAAVAFGSVATSSRHWDGAASFDAKVFWLTASPTLQQPFFAAEGVFHHSPDYPLLPALLFAATDRLAPGFGRVMAPLWYLLLCGVVAAGLHRRGVHALLRLGTVLAVAVTPALLTSGGGAVDSGYGELPLLLATTTIACGLLNRSALWFGLGIGLATVIKPEGLFYGLGAVLVAFVHADRALLRGAFAAFLLAALTWLPVRATLLHTDVERLPFVLLAGASLCIWLLLRATASRTKPTAIRWWIALAAPAVALAALPWIAGMVSAESSIGVYLRQAQSVWAGLANLPAYFEALAEHGVTRLRLGTSLLVPPIAAIVGRVARRPLGAERLAAFVLLGLTTTALPFVLSPEDDLQHHLRSSLPRLLLHWVGPAWLLSAVWIERLREPSGTPLRD